MARGLCFQRINRYSKTSTSTIAKNPNHHPILIFRKHLLWEPSLPSSSRRLVSTSYKLCGPVDGSDDRQWNYSSLSLCHNKIGLGTGNLRLLEVRMHRRKGRDSRRQALALRTAGSGTDCQVLEDARLCPGGHLDFLFLRLFTDLIPLERILCTYLVYVS